jgi:hypothetical protein
MSTLDALECLGLCPANFEWFELNVPRKKPTAGVESIGGQQANRQAHKERHSMACPVCLPS